MTKKSGLEELENGGWREEVKQEEVGELTMWKKQILFKQIEEDGG